jgi:hypothetical protein
MTVQELDREQLIELKSMYLNEKTQKWERKQAGQKLQQLTML